MKLKGIAKQLLRIIKIFYLIHNILVVMINFELNDKSKGNKFLNQIILHQL